MTSQRTGWRLLVAAVAAAALLAALTIAPRPAGADAPVAQSADQAGDVYKSAIKKATAKRDAKLKKCKNKPTKAKRKACAKGAKAKFKKAKAEAQRTRDDARKDAGSEPERPENPAEAKDELKDCLRSGKPRAECMGDYRDDRRSGKGRP